MNEELQYSEQGLRLTKDSEGLELVAYPDPGTKNHPDPIERGKPWTIGYGHTKGVYPGMTCTEAQADAWLREDVKWAERAVKDLVEVRLSQGQYDALVDFVFNVGRKAFLNSELLQKLNQGRYSEVDAELAEWIFSGGKVFQGLVTRRARAAQLFDDEEPDSI